MKGELELPLILHKDHMTSHQKRNGTKTFQGHNSFHDSKKTRKDSCQKAADNDTTNHSLYDKRVHTVLK